MRERAVVRSCSRQKMKSLRLTRVIRWRSCWREEAAVDEPTPEPDATWGGTQRSFRPGVGGEVSLQRLKSDTQTLHIYCIYTFRMRPGGARGQTTNPAVHGQLLHHLKTALNQRPLRCPTWPVPAGLCTMTLNNRFTTHQVLKHSDRFSAVTIGSFTFCLMDSQTH